MKPTIVRSAVVLAVSATLLAGCGKGEPAAHGGSPSSSAVTTTVTTTTGASVPTQATTTPRPPASTRPGPATSQLANGRYCAWLTALDRHARTLRFDVVQWLTGDAADAAFHREHPEAPDTGAPNGYYIVNQNPRLRTLPVAPGARVSVVWGEHGTEPRTISFAEFPGYLAGDVDPHDHTLWYDPFWLTVHNGRITAIDEQYVP
jgi:hypothetical protein